jgi:hypothetical protein
MQEKKPYQAEAVAIVALGLVGAVALLAARYLMGL